MTTTWRLYIDETGAFEKREDPSLITGLLIRRTSPQLAGASLRDALYRAAPDLPWPFHANRVGFPVTLALGVALEARAVGFASNTADDATSVEALAERVACLLELHAGEKLRRALEVLAVGEFPEWTLLKSLDRCVAHRERLLYDQLTRIHRDTMAALRGVVAEAQRPGQDLFFASGEGSNGCAASGGRAITDLGWARYSHLMHLLLIQVVDLLTRLGETHTVVVDALSRPLINARGEREQMGRHHLEAIIRKVRRSRPSAPVELVAGEVSFFNSETDVFLVLADFAANSAYKALTNASRALASAERSLHDRVGAITRAAGLPSLVGALPKHGTPRVRVWVREADAEWQAAGRTQSPP